MPRDGKQDGLDRVPLRSETASPIAEDHRNGAPRRVGYHPKYAAYLENAAFEAIADQPVGSLTLGDLESVRGPSRRPAGHGGADGFPALDRLTRLMQDDPLEQNRVAAAETVARLLPSPQAVSGLADLLDRGSSQPVRLQALNALTFVGAQARTALPAIKRAALADDEAIHNAGRYLEAVTEDRYDPAYPVLDVEWIVRKYGGFKG